MVILPFPVIAAAVAAPAVVAAVSALVEGIWNIYATEETTSNNDRVADYNVQYQTGALYENEKYFDRYIRAHHIQNREIMFPYRTGYNYNLGSLYSNEAALSNNAIARQGSWVTAFTRGARGFSRIAGLYG